MEHYNNEGPDIVKQLAGLISLALFCAGAVLVEYEIAWRVGGAFIFLAGACGLAVVSRALYTAPEGEERADGFHKELPMLMGEKLIHSQMKSFATSPRRFRSSC